MSDAPSHVPDKSILPNWVKGPQDFVGGMALVAIALFALWASSDLQGMHGFSFGAGTAPRMFGDPAAGARRCRRGRRRVHRRSAACTIYAWRGPLFVSLAILSFALMHPADGHDRLGDGSFLIAALGTPETRWKETIIVGVCLTTFCALLFPYALGLPLQMWPSFLIR